MLRTLFNKAAKPSYIPQKPVIVVSTLEDDKSRGDSNAYKRLGQLIADKIGGEYRYVDENFLMTKYPDSSDYRAALSIYIEENGTPDIVFARYRHQWIAEKDLYSKSKNPFYVQGINEYMTKEITGEKEQVSHHLTPALLKEEGIKFRSAHPDMPKNLVAVIVADCSLGCNFPETLLSSLPKNEQTGIFICTSRRTPSENFEYIMQSMSFHMDGGDSTDHLVLRGYDFRTGREQNAYNPYMGLINEADHIVIIGSSQSIVSESLSRGKSVYLHENYDPYDESEKAGLVKYFNTMSAHKNLQTDTVTVYNPTECLADGLIKKYRRHCQKQLGIGRRALAYLMDG